MATNRVELQRIDPNVGQAGDSLFNYVELLTHFDETDLGDNWLKDSSSSNYTVTAKGDAQRATGSSSTAFGDSLLLDGNGDYLTIAHHSDFNISSSDSTIEFWYKYISTSSNGHDALSADVVLSKGNSNVQNIGWQFVTGSTGLYFMVTNQSVWTSGSLISSHSSINTSDGNWHHIAVTHTYSTNTLEMFIDGSSAGTLVTSGYTIDNSSYKLLIGAGYGYNNNAEGFYFSNCQLDEIRISNVARTIENNVPTAPYTSDSNTKLLLHFTQSTVLEGAVNSPDSSVRAHQLLFQGSAQLTELQKQFGAASLKLDGDSDYIKISDNTSSFDFGTANFVMEAWANFSDKTTTQTIFGNNYFEFLRYVNVISGSGNYWDAQGTIAKHVWYDYFLEFGLNNGSPIEFSANEGDKIEIKIEDQTSGNKLGKGWYTEAELEHTGNWLDDTSASDHDVTAHGDVEQCNGCVHSASFGDSADFDGIGDYLSIPDHPDFNFGSGDFTMEAWVYVNAGSTFFSIFEQQDSSANGRAFVFYLNNGTQPAFGFNDDGTSSGWVYHYGTDNSVSANTWTHVAVAKQGNNATFFVGGAPSGTFTESRTMYNPTIDLKIGAGSTGRIDEIRISNVARWTSNFTPPTAPYVNDSNTKLLLHFDRTNALLSLANYNTVYASAEVENIILPGGYSYFAPKTDTYKLTRISTRLSGSPTGDGNRALRVKIYVNGVQVGATSGTENKLRFSYYDMALGFSGGTKYLDYDNWDISTDKWYHLAVERNDTTLKLYIDGVGVASTTVATNESLGTASILTLGSSWGGSDASNYFNGYLDEMRITKGKARYKENFQKLTAKFPDSAGTNLQQVITNSDGTELVLGTAGLDTKQLATAWVTFDGTGTVTILDSYNVSSITDLGIGKYRINFATAMDNINYSVVGSSENGMYLSTLSGGVDYFDVIIWERAVSYQDVGKNSIIFFGGK